MSADLQPAPEPPLEWSPAERVSDRRARRFGPASEEPYRRRTTDGLRLAVAAAALAQLAAHVGEVSALQRAVLDAFGGLPPGFGGLARAVERLAGLWAAGLLVAAAVGARRWRLARDLLLAGALAWLVARGLGLAVGGELRGHYGAVFRQRVTPSFPTVPIALVTAVLRTASPYVGRAVRRTGRVFLLLLLPADLYLGLALPRDLVAGLLVGWGVAAAVHLALGSPGGRPTAEQVQTSLADLGVRARNVRLAGEQPAGSTLMLAEDATGPLHLTVVGRDETDSRLLAQVWHVLVYRDAGPRVFLSRAQQVEHQAYVLLLAADRGARVPRVAGAGMGGPSAAVLAERVPDGPLLAELAPAQVDDSLLDATWRQVAGLRSAAIAHGRLTTRHVVVAPSGPVLIGFGLARTRASSTELAGDLAELLATSAAVVGPARAVAAVTRVLPAAALEAALPLLQPLAMSREGRALVGAGRREQRDRIGALRAEAARRLGVAEPALVQLRRVRTRSLALALGTLVGVAGVLGQVSDPAALLDAARHARPVPVVLAFGFAALSSLAYAVAFLGSVPQRLPFLATLRLQVTGPFANLALPVGAQALQVRFLQQQGLPAASAVAATGVVSTGFGIVIQVGIFAIASLLSPRPLHLDLLPRGLLPELLLAVAAVLMVGSVVVLTAGPVRRWVHREASSAAATVWQVLRSPRLLTLQVVGNLGVAFSFGLCLAACLSAYGESLPLATLLAVNIAVTTVAMVVPIPGGNTAVGSVGLTGALVALGIPAAPAVGIVLLDQLATAYLPAVPGWFVLRGMLGREEI